MKKKIIIGSGIFLLAVLTALFSMRGASRQLGTSSTGLSVDSFPSSLPAPGGIASPLPLQDYSSKSTGASLQTESLNSGSAAIDLSQDKKIIKTGNLALKVSDIEKSSESLQKIAKENGGDVFSSRFYGAETKSKMGTVVIKVPVDKFDQAFAEIKKIAVLVISESTSGNDVTEEYADLAAQVNNKKAEEASFAKLLGSAQKMEDILAVTRELSRVRGEIERLEGRIRFLNSQTDMSSITVNLSEDSEITFTDTWRPFQLFKDTTNNLFKDFQAFINFLIVLVIRVIPIFVLYGIIILIIYKIGRRIYQRFKKDKGEIPKNI